MCNCWHTSPKQRPMFLENVNDLKNLSRLYSNDEKPGTFNSHSAFFLKQQQRLQPPLQAFPYNDKDINYLLTAPITAADAVSLTFSAFGSTGDLNQTGKVVWWVITGSKMPDHLLALRLALQSVPQKRHCLQFHT